ncbi:MAG: hypothetical protein GC134_06700 [Proteobacteria bacterium]|nr:hypothetical protein [Pseudomonadota bacterium]
MYLADKILLGILWLCAAAVAAIIGLLVFVAIDSIGVDTHPEPGTVTGRTFTAAHTTHGMIMAGKVMVPTTTHYPDKWTFDVKLVSGPAVTCTVSKSQYDAIADGSAVTAIVKSGRLSNDTYCDGIK